MQNQISREQRADCGDGSNDHGSDAKQQLSTHHNLLVVLAITPAFTLLARMSAIRRDA